MEREQIERHLVETTDAIARSAAEIVTQQAQVAALEAAGRDAREATRRLAELQQRQIMHFADRDRLLMALAKVATEDTAAPAESAKDSAAKDSAA
jgi:multidrug resistance efflux pump